MEIIIIGSGTGVPNPRRGAPALMVRGGGLTVQCDLGSGTLKAQADQGLDFNDLDVVFLSHWHPDHVGDLVPFLFATRYALGYTRTRPFILLAARGFGEFFTRLKGAFGDWIEPPPGLMQVQELGPDRDEVQLGTLAVKAAPVNHIGSSLAARLEADGKAVVYSGDTDWSETLIDLMRGADLAILEASFPTKMAGHLTPEEAGEMAARAGVPRLLLTHIYPPGDRVDLRAAAARAYPGEIMVAADGLRLTV